MKQDFDHRTVHHMGATQASVDEGLRSYLLKVYNYMALGLSLTGVVAYFVFMNEGLQQAIFGSGLAWIVMLAPLAFVLVLSFGIHRMSSGTAQIVFWVFAAVMGVSLSSVFLVYTGASIAKTFFVTAGTFAGMSLYGYTTKRDLTRMGSFLIMGLFGLILASLVQLFVASPALEFLISVAGVLIFVGLTAYDTQVIKNSYFEQDDVETSNKKAIMGALSLYLDFINLFLYLLRFMGNRR